MQINTSRRSFIRSMFGVAAVGAAGRCFAGKAVKGGKVRLAVVGVEGKGYIDWMLMQKTGLVEIVAFCDADASQLPSALARAKKDFPDLDFSKVPFYVDYRKLLDDAGMLGIDAMTISTPDHVHAPVAIGAMKQGIHVYVQKPLVHTLGELSYFEKTARENRVIVQMANQGSSFDSMRRCTEVIQSGILGDVKEVHVWTNRPVWPQGKRLGDYIHSRSSGDKIPKGLDWNVFLATAADRPYLGKIPKNLGKFHNARRASPNVYHRFSWRSSVDFGLGAFGDMACHTMNLAFRGLELGPVSGAECTMIEGASDVVYPEKSIVRMDYKARESKIRKGVKLPAVTLYWYDGDEKPKAEIMPKWAAAHDGKVPYTGCYIIGSKGAVLMQDDYGGKCAIALDADKEFVDIFQHEAAKAVARSIPFCRDTSDVPGTTTKRMKDLGIGHYFEFIDAVRGVGPVIEQTHSRCFSDIEYCVPQMEGILVGCVAQRIPGRNLAWDAAAQKFDCESANALVSPPARKGWAF